jgi:hypothetical protein
MAQGLRKGCVVNVARIPGKDELVVVAFVCENLGPCFRGEIRLDYAPSWLVWRLTCSPGKALERW